MKSTLVMLSCILALAGSMVAMAGCSSEDGSVETGPGKSEGLEACGGAGGSAG